MTADRLRRFRRGLGLIALGAFSLAMGGAAALPAERLDPTAERLDPTAEPLESFVLAANDAKKPAAKGAKGKGNAPAKATPAAAPKPPAQQTAAAPPAATVMERAQLLLAKKGRFSGKIDGQATPNMTRALLAYQAEQGLPQTGRLDAATIGRMGISKP